MSTKPKGRHKGIGMNKPKKKKVIPLLLAPDIAIDTVEADATPCLQSPAPDLDPPALLDRCDTTPELLDRDERAVFKRYAQAKHQLAVVERRWKKKKETYHESGKHSPWVSKSIVQRTELRQYETDQHVGEARALCAHRRDRWKRLLSLNRWTTIFRANRFDAATQTFYLRAVNRFTEPTAVPHWKSMWPGLVAGGDIRDHAAQSFGIAATWGLMHVDELKGAPAKGEDGEDLSWEPKQVAARAKAHSEEWFRGRIRARMEAEKDDPSLRYSRGCMLGWPIRAVNAYAILQEFGLCVCPFPRAVCELCKLRGTVPGTADGLSDL